MVSEAMEITHEDRCEDALDLYEEMVKQTSHSSSLIPRAIEFYKEHWKGDGERKLVYTPGKLAEALKEGWKFDPWLNPRGRPIPIGGPITVGGNVAESDGAYWILVKGSPKWITRLEPFVELPEDEEEEPEPMKPDPYGLRTEYIPYDKEGQPSRDPTDGYVIMHKDHVYAKGTVYTLPPKPISPWALSIQLATLSPHLGVDEAHDVITGILDKKQRGF